jgi:high-affinity iron transporter
MEIFLATFILFLREGLEACLIISILLTVLRQLRLTRHNRSVWIGVGLALVCAFAFALVLKAISSLLPPNYLDIFKAVTYLAAVLIVTWMTFWVQEHSRTLKQELTVQASAASSGLALGVLAFSTVGREGAETAIFALAFALSGDAVALLLGALAGTLVAIGLGIAIYRFGYRINYRIFFRVMGLLLLLLAAGLLSNAINRMQLLGWLPIGTDLVWDNPGLEWISENGSILGGLLHILVGYTDQISVLQIIGFVAFLTIAGGFFWRATRAPQKQKKAPEYKDNEQQIAPQP